MKKYIPLFLIVLISCSLNSRNEISLFNNISFKIYDNEYVTTITDSIKDNYLKKIEPKKKQIPLFRYIEGDDYTMYIGIPFNASLSHLIGSKLNGSTITALTDSSTYKYEEYGIDSLHTTELVVQIDKSILYILCETKSENAQNCLFNKDSLIQRINIKQ